MSCSVPGSSVNDYLRVSSNACLLSLWCNLTISSSDAPSSFCPQSFPAALSFPMISSSHQVVKVLELQLQDQSFQWVFRVDFLRIDWIELLAVQGTLKSLLQHRSTTIRKHQFFGAQPSLWSNSHIHRVKTIVFVVVHVVEKPWMVLILADWSPPRNDRA